jgi:predicted nucleic acid-binding protein
VRVFLDANVLFSASKSDGAVREMVTRLLRSGHELIADEYVIAEARRNLAAFGVEAVATLDALLSSVEVAAFRDSHLPQEFAGFLPAKDAPVLAAALRLRCDALVTGDRRHFGALYGTVQRGLAIHSPRSLAEALGL